MGGNQDLSKALGISGQVRGAEVSACRTWGKIERILDLTAENAFFFFSFFLIFNFFPCRLKASSLQETSFSLQDLQIFQFGNLRALWAFGRQEEIPADS